MVDANALFEAMSSLVSRFNPFGKVTEVSPSHPKNASTPMLVNPSGKVTEVSPLHPENAYFPMLVNPLERSLGEPCAVIECTLSDAGQPPSAKVTE